MSQQADGKKEFVICINNDGYPASLEKWKIYQSLDDPEARAVRRIRVIDESGEDYLYPEDWFVPVALPQPVIDAYTAAR